MPAKKISLLFLAALWLTSAAPTHAQEGSFTIATTHEVLEEAQDGDVVSFSAEKQGLVLSREAYDKRVFAVVATEPQIVYRTGEGNGSPLVRDGVVYVNVSTVNEEIAPGDYVTSSPIPGKAQKATSSTGHILGIAIDEFREGTGEKTDYEGKEVWVGKIRVALAIGPVSPALFLLKSSSGAVGALDQLGNALMQTFQEPDSGFVIMRYILAALVTLSATFISFRNFGRNITQGIEALGRNPLARREIELMIIFNVILIAVASIVSVLFSLAIIRF